MIININRQSVSTPVRRNYLFCLMVIVLCARHILQLLGFSELAAVLFEVLYILTALFMAVSVVRNLIIKHAAFPLMVLLMGIGVMFYLVWKLMFSYRAYLEQSLTFVLVFPLLFSSDAVKVTEKDAKLYFQGMTLIGVLLSVLAFVPSSYENGLLLLYTRNGNQSGLLYMSIFFGIFVYQFTHKRNWFRYGILALLLYGCWKTESRTSVIACIFLVILAIFLKKMPKWNKKALYISYGVYIAMPFIVSFLVKALGADFEILGASAWTGREELWPDIIQTLTSDPFGFKIDQVVHELYGVDLGAHNVWLTVGWNYSVPVTVVFLISVFCIGNTFLRNSHGKNTAVLIACFIGGLLHMSFESAIICGALDFSLYFLCTLFAGKAFSQKMEEI